MKRVLRPHDGRVWFTVHFGGRNAEFSRWAGLIGAADEPAEPLC